jgi:hypothetical protein
MGASVASHRGALLPVDLSHEEPVIGVPMAPRQFGCTRHLRALRVRYLIAELSLGT